MKANAFASLVGLLLSLPLSLTAATLYVDLNNLAAAFPYNDWASAATNIQDAVDAAGVGDEVVVTNGVYQAGGRLVYGTLTNRVAVTNAITLRSVNGPAVTLIQGYQMPGTTNGDSAVRCIYLADGATLIGFTLTNGATRGATSPDYPQASGGGAWCQSTNAYFSNCVFIANSCYWCGAGAYSGTLINCKVEANINFNRSPPMGGGGGAAFSGLIECTLTGNRGGAGAALSCSLTNCVVNGNYDGGVRGCTLDGCLVTGNAGPGISGGLAKGCLVSGNAGTGISGGVANNCTISSNAASYNMSMYAGGGAYNSTLSNCVMYANRATNGGGAYDCSLSHCILSNNLATHYGGGVYVDSYAASGITNCTLVGNTANDTGGGLYASSAGKLVLDRCVFAGNVATNYGGGYGGLAGSVNGCVFSNNWAGIRGGGVYSTGSSKAFTNCAIQYNSAGTQGGGSYNMYLTQCNLSQNQAPDGGGAYGGILTGCTLSSNSAPVTGGGASQSTLSACVLTWNQGGNGGGAAKSVLTACTVANNVAVTNGGGAWNSGLRNCLFTGNSALSGGGAIDCTPNNCTFVGNSATNSGGGLSGGAVYNSIIYYNTAPTSSNYYNSSLSACCAMPQANGIGDITNEPVFVDMSGGNFRLQANSPCINAGNNSYAAGPDMDLRTRIVDGTVDIGAYEFQGPGMGEFIPWLQQYGLPANGSADFTDPDIDGMNNWQEWICGTDPTNSLSVLTLLGASSNEFGITVAWQGVSTRTYFLERSTDLLARPMFTPIQSNIVGQAGTTIYTDNSATSGGPYIYRVGIQ